MTRTLDPQDLIDLRSSPRAWVRRAGEGGRQLLLAAKRTAGQRFAPILPVFTFGVGSGDALIHAWAAMPCRPIWKLSPVVVLVLAVNAGCSDGCGNTIVSSKEAPDARHVAVLFQRDCGATTGFSTQISVLDAGKQPSGSGNVFTADDDHGAAPAAPWGGPWAELAWLSPSRLLVRYDSKARVFQRSETMSGVQVSFEPVVRR